MDGIGGEVVLPFEIGDGDAALFGDFPERVASLDSVNVSGVGAAVPAGQGEATDGASDELAKLTAIEFHTENAGFPKKFQNRSHRECSPCCAYFQIIFAFGGDPRDVRRTESGVSICV